MCWHFLIDCCLPRFGSRGRESWLPIGGRSSASETWTVVNLRHTDSPQAYLVDGQKVGTPFYHTPSYKCVPTALGTCSFIKSSIYSLCLIHRDFSSSRRL